MKIDRNGDDVVTLQAITDSEKRFLLMLVEAFRTGGSVTAEPLGRIAYRAVCDRPAVVNGDVARLNADLAAFSLVRLRIADEGQ